MVAILLVRVCSLEFVWVFDFLIVAFRLFSELTSGLFRSQRIE